MQLVHGMPNEAASQRTCLAVMRCWLNATCGPAITHFPRMAGCEWWLAIVFRSTEVPRLIHNLDITPRASTLPEAPSDERAQLGRTYFRMLDLRAAVGRTDGPEAPTVRTPRACML